MVWTLFFMNVTMILYTSLSFPLFPDVQATIDHLQFRRLYTASRNILQHSNPDNIFLYRLL